MEDLAQINVSYNNDEVEENVFYCSPVKGIQYPYDADDNGVYDSDGYDEPRLLIDESSDSQHDVSRVDDESGNVSSDYTPKKPTKRKQTHKPVKKTIRKLKPITSILTRAERAIIRKLGAPKYHKNMIRQFVLSAKTPDEQLKRNKNTEAARNSRTLAKFAEEKLMQNVISGRQRNDEIFRDIIISLSNIAKWQTDLGLPTVDWRNEWLAEEMTNEEINDINDNFSYLNNKYLICNALR